MVFKSLVQLIRSRGPDEFWRKRRVLRIAAHQTGRRRNCYSVAVRAVHHALVYATQARVLRRQDARQLWDTRVTAAAAERGLDVWRLREGLDRLGLLLNAKSQAELAAWEPATFDALVAIAANHAKAHGLDEPRDSPNHVHRPIALPLYLDGLLDEVD